MSRILCVAVVLAALSGPAAAGMSEGMAAVTVGDYDKAIAEFQPLAASGDPAAQYQLAKIYLEGRGPAASPAEGLAQGIALMAKAADANYPEAQAQLGLMHAMGLGVAVDNAKAYDLLSKAVSGLPSGTRRTVAEANRDAVLKRMSASEQSQVAAATKAPAPTKAPATAPAASAKPAATQAAAKTDTAKKPETASKQAETTTAKTAPAKPTTGAPATSTTKTVTEAAATNKTATDKTANNATAPAKTSDAAKTPETTAPAKPTEVASAKAPQATPAATPTVEAQKQVPTGVRIQLVSMPSEEAAWSAWKQLSGKYSSQLTGLTATVETADLGAKGKFYRVQTGPFDTVAAAQERCTAMKEAGLDCLVVGKP